METVYGGAVSITPQPTRHDASLVRSDVVNALSYHR